MTRSTVREWHTARTSIPAWSRRAVSAAWEHGPPRLPGHDGSAMTSLLTRPDSARNKGARTSGSPNGTARQRPLVLIATLGGACAALAPLVVLLAVGVIGWFVTDAGVHGAPRDGMRMGALAWLAGH